MGDVGQGYWFKSTLGNIFLIFAFGSVIGCICLNIIWRVQGNIYENDWVFALGKIHRFIETISYLPKKKHVIYLMIVYVFIFLLGFWKYGKILLQGLMVSFGFLTGGIETIWLLNFNMKEGIDFIFDFLSRTIGIAITTLVVMSLAIHRSKKGKKYTKSYIFFMLLVLILCLVYIILCSYVNLT